MNESSNTYIKGRIKSSFRSQVIVRVCFPLLLAMSFPPDINAEDTKITPCIWKDCRAGAVSISLDDTQISCLRPLARHHFKATYYVSRFGIIETRERQKWRYQILKGVYQAGNEVGGHSYSHPCLPVSAAKMRQEFLLSMLYLRDMVGVPMDGIITMSWPCGFVQHKEIAAEYFLAARGYCLNQLEDPTPQDFMNLKSFNSPEHNLSVKRPNLKRAVLQAEQEGKWAILVFHYTCNLFNVIDFAATRDVWVAPVGTVIKYILQRNSLYISDCQETKEGLIFTVSRPPARSTPIRQFELAFNKSDVVTLKIDIGDAQTVRAVRSGHENIPYQSLHQGRRHILLINVFVPSTGEKRIEIDYARQPFSKASKINAGPSELSSNTFSNQPL